MRLNLAPRECQFRGAAEQMGGHDMMVVEIQSDAVLLPLRGRYGVAQTLEAKSKKRKKEEEKI